MATSINKMEQYDRQNRTFGKEGTKSINNSRIYLYGLEGGLGSEVAKNLALSGIKELYLIDNDKINQKDIDYGYYYNQKDINLQRSLVIKNHIQELNPYTSVNTLSEKGLELIEPNSYVIVCNKTISEAVNINVITRKNNCKMVFVFSKGLAGFVFVDSLENHIVYDLDGENIEPIEMNEILEDGTVLCNKHKLRENSLVEFVNVKGDNIDFLYGNKFRIYDVKQRSFSLKNYDNSKFNYGDFNFINGTVKIINEPTVFNHLNLEEQFSKDYYNIIGFDTINDQNIINTFKVIDKYKNDFNDPWDIKMDNFLKNFKSEYHPMIRTIGLELTPVNSILGGFASTELIKLITKKYTPISQFYVWHDFSLLPKERPKSNNNNILDLTFGSEFVKKILSANVLMVGCGALGCEWLKNLSLLNIGIEGNVTVTDPDHIEISNLSRQFLFRSKDVGKSKTQTAVNSIIKNNPLMNLVPLVNKLTKDDKNLTNRLFMDRNIIINALDNIEARKFVDSQCFDRNLPLFESGTMGMKGNTQPVIPFLTETYGNSNDPEIEEEFPVCTIKNYPNSIQHTIHWARDYFEIFNRGIMNVNKFIDNPNFYKELSGIEYNQAIEDLNLFLGKYDLTQINGCIEFSKDIYIKEYNHKIKQLLHCFPFDHIVNGSLFWSQGKRCPKTLDFDNTNEEIINFIDATIKILCKCFKNPWKLSINKIKDIILKSTIPIFNPNEKVKIAKNDSELKNIKNNNVNILSTRLYLPKIKCEPQEFEKDDDTNHHVYWLSTASNCRALNYSILPVSKYDTKGIAGKIIPAVATTTSTIVGLICMEMLKYISDTKLEDYRSYYLNMADNTNIYSEPMKIKDTIIGDTKINGWTKFSYKKNTSLKKLIEYCENLFKTKVNMIIQDTKIIHSEFIPSELDKDLITIFKEFDINLLKELVNLTLSSSDENIELPLIQLNLVN